MRIRFASPLFLFLALAVRLPTQSTHPEPRFAIEMVSSGDDSPYYVIVSGGPTTDGYVRFFPSALAPQPADRSAPSSEEIPCAFGLEYKENGEFVEIVASVYFGHLDPHNPNLTNHPSKQIGTYSLRFGESVELQQMKEFGLPPYKITIVTAQVPVSNTPTFSKVPSLQLAITREDRTTFKLMVRNLSSQTVTGLEITRSGEYSHSSITTLDDRSSVLLPGATRDYVISSQKLSCPSTESPAADPVPCPIVLEAAIFADGSHAGVPSVAASLEVSQRAASVQRQQFEESLKPIMDDASLSEADKLAQLRSAIQESPSAPDPAILDTIRTKYPGLFDDEWANIQKSTKSAFQWNRKRVLADLASFVRTQDFPDPPTLSEWINRIGFL